MTYFPGHTGFIGHTGRVDAVRAICRFVTDPGTGSLAVVTGVAGSGKSTVLALPVVLADPERRTDLLAPAGPGGLPTRAAEWVPVRTPIVAVQARRLDSDRLAATTGRVLGRDASTASALLGDLHRMKPRDRRQLPVVTIDAVDEATDPGALITDLIAPLARQCHIRILLGCRRQLLTLLPPADVVIDLNSDDYADPRALVTYVKLLLTADREPHVTTPYRAGRPPRSDAAASIVANEVATRAGGSFLLARLSALALRARQSVIDVNHPLWRGLLPRGMSAFDEGLVHLGLSTARSWSLLRALAWAGGPGLPRDDLWLPVAQQLADTAYHPWLAAPLCDEDIERLLARAGAYITQDRGPDGGVVYRPCHDLLADHLRQSTTIAGKSWSGSLDEPAIHGAITEALLGTVPRGPRGPLWADAHPYLRAHLAEHAHAAGAVSFTRLLSDSGFLAWAEPATLTPLLGDATDTCRDIVRVYRRASTQLGTEAAVNAAVLQESALVLQGQPMFSGGSEIEPRYSTDLVSTTVDNSILTLTHGDQHESIGPIAFGTGPDGRLLLASNGNHVLRLWDVRTGRPVGRPLERDGSLVAVGFATDGRLLVASRGRGDTLHIRQAGDTRDLTRITIDGARFVSAAVLGTAPDGQLVLVVATDSTVQVRNIATGEPVGPPLAGETMHMEAVACATTRKGRLLVAAGRARQVRIWDAGTGRLVGGHNGDPTPVISAVAIGTGDWSPVLAAGNFDGTVRLWCTGTPLPLSHPLVGHTERVTALAFTSTADGGLLLASGGGDGTVRFWDLGRPSSRGGFFGRPQVRLEPTGQTDSVGALALGPAPDGRLLLVSATLADRTVRFWDADTGQALGEPLTAHTTRVTQVALGSAPDGRLLLACAGWDRTVRLWDTGIRRRARRVRTHSQVNAIALGTAPDGRLLLASAGGDVVTIRDAMTGRKVGAPVTGHDAWVIRVAFGATSDGRLFLASAGEGRSMRVWLTDVTPPVRRGNRRHEPRRAGRSIFVGTLPVTALAFGRTPDGRLLLASGGWDRTVRLWDGETGQMCGEPLTGHTKNVTGLAFGTAPDGRPLLASASEDHTIRLWDIADRRACLTIPRRDPVRTIAFQGPRLAIGGTEGLTVMTLTNLS